MSDALKLRIGECRDCPRFKMRAVQHWLLDNQVAYEYICTKANRFITPSDGVRPPPSWCPLRAALTQEEPK